ncbi:MULTISPECIES: hypothetical protein [unclassified Treponema]|uniref:hypothetical protein n=1 Tax=unclassified Treponema TaxID=2638727 RepID=UPI0020A4A5FA|nr:MULTISPECIES: hypothetical protein [unclassified Treponema]UTC68332.1 hypothetical protein E4O06_06810 [Treponema sp. OMZ 789]UTC71053.1 hypothetical protein E4O01_06955 [Treponema sp. OMZ 790]UTC73794.1 hypothetical protein E4O02_07150 [Treponema sp. OMZ 791]
MQNLEDLKKMIEKGELNVSEYKTNLFNCFSDLFFENYTLSLSSILYDGFSRFSCRYSCYAGCSNGGAPK